MRPKQEAPVFLRNETTVFIIWLALWQLLCDRERVSGGGFLRAVILTELGLIDTIGESSQY